MQIVAFTSHSNESVKLIIELYENGAADFYMTKDGTSVGCVGMDDTRRAALLRVLLAHAAPETRRDIMGWLIKDSPLNALGQA